MSDTPETLPVRRQNIKIASGVSKEVKLIESSAKAQTVKKRKSPKVPPQEKVMTSKKIGNLYPKVYDIKNLETAHTNAKKGKGWLLYCDSYRLAQKYIAPLEPYADKFYKEVVLNGNNSKRC